MSSPPLRKWAISGVMIVTLSIGIAGFIAGGLAVHGINGEVDTKELGELQDLQNTTGIAQTARERSENLEARSEFFSLPGVVNTLRTVFQSIPIWQTFIGVTIETFGIQYATENWPEILAVSSLLILISYKVVMRLR